MKIFNKIIKKDTTKYFLVIIAMIFFSMFSWWQQDDFYIHLQYVKNLIELNSWSFSGLLPSYGTTSPLWVITLFIFGKIGINLILTAKLLSVLCSLVIFWIVLIKREKYTNKNLFLILIISLAFNHWGRLSAGSGMEATFAAFIFFVIILFLMNKEIVNKNIIIMGILNAALIMIRPEFVYVPFLIFIYYVFKTRKKIIVPSIFLACFFLILIPWILYSFHNFNAIIPTTVAVKSLNINPSFESFCYSFSKVFIFYFSSNAIEFVILIFISLHEIRNHKNKNIKLENILIVFLIFGLIFIYLINGATNGEIISYRYGFPIIPSLLYFSYTYLDNNPSFRINKYFNRKKYIIAIIGVIILSNSFLTVWHFPSLIKSYNYVENVLVKYGTYLKKNANPNDVVACYDIGAVGFYSQIKVLDLIGLVTPETIKFKDVERVNYKAINYFKPKYFIKYWLHDSCKIYPHLPSYEILLQDTVFNYRMSLNSDKKIYITQLIKLNW